MQSTRNLICKATLVLLKKELFEFTKIIRKTRDLFEQNLLQKGTSCHRLRQFDSLALDGNQAKVRPKARYLLIDHVKLM